MKLLYHGVGETEAAQISWHLQAKGTHLFQTLHGVILHLLQGIVLSRVIYLLSS